MFLCFLNVMSRIYLQIYRRMNINFMRQNSGQLLRDGALYLCLVPSDLNLNDVKVV